MSENRPSLERALGQWLMAHLGDYTGMANVETIGGAIIECHLRFADQWPDLYGGDDWVRAVVELYSAGRWSYDDRARRDGYSVVAWGPHAAPRHAPPAALASSLLENRQLSSVQITFHAEDPQAAHSMPPGGFRIAVVNSWNLAAGRSAASRLREAILGASRE
jgi:hypothetical protein